MIPVVREDELSCLGLPDRVCFRLNQCGLHTIGQLLDCWNTWHSLPAYAGEEAHQVLKELTEGEFFLLADLGVMREFWGEGLPNIPVGCLGLDDETVALIQQAGRRSLADVTLWQHRKNRVHSGVKPAVMDRVLDVCREYWQLPRRIRGNQAMAQGLRWLIEAANRISAFTGLTATEAAREISAALEELPKEPDPAAFRQIFQREPLRRAISHGILFLLREKPEGILRQEILELLPEGTSRKDLDDLLADMEFHMQVWLWDELVQYRFPSIRDYVDSLQNRKVRCLMLDRLKGGTLEDAGWRQGFSRQRASELTHAALNRRPYLREDRYLSLFKRYNFTREDFVLCFDEPQETWNYLSILYTTKAGKKPLVEMLEDETIPLIYRRRVPRALSRNDVEVEPGVFVKKTRIALSRYYVRTLCQDPITMSDFAEVYRRNLRELGLDQDPALAIEPRSYENKFNSCTYALWSKNHRFRWYPMEERDFSSFLEALDLDRFQNVEISSLKLFRDHAALMEEYDIRDEYELHNLMKKVWPADDPRPIVFKKMPTIVFGKADRNRQVVELMKRHSPITGTELAVLYEELYGAKEETVKANYLECIQPWLDRRLYRVDRPDLPGEQGAFLKAALTDDFYRLEEIQALCAERFPDMDPFLVNAISLRGVGFVAFSDYALRDTWRTAAEYFRDRITSRDELDMREDLHRFTGIVACSTELSNLKAKRELVEIQPGRFYSCRKLEQMGVTKEEMESYCQAVSGFVDEGDYFTVFSLKKAGFHHSLHEKSDLGPFFCASVLREDREHFSCQRQANVRIFRRGGRSFRLSDFFCHLIEERGGISVMDLRSLLQETYGLPIQPGKIVTILQDTPILYEPTLREFIPSPASFSD